MKSRGLGDVYKRQHLKVENHIDHRSYARQGKLEIPTIHEGADARKIDEKFQNGQQHRQLSLKRTLNSML